ncbi:hypothetical protein CH375_00900 [Leptospira ellisii]|uniref:Uncharacterized protein n=1 Tax=Leptospira ellisii TaxID=2023197 RepID=A0A2N0BQF9_9LEPT|nr:hypothetical protein CH379_08100 [Leptospira ellisii]PKA06221.1 hypothetical protein CH375_00900 [Leptospira ellisii]
MRLDSRISEFLFRRILESISILLKIAFYKKTERIRRHIRPRNIRNGNTAKRGECDERDVLQG